MGNPPVLKAGQMSLSRGQPDAEIRRPSPVAADYPLPAVLPTADQNVEIPGMNALNAYAASAEIAVKQFRRVDANSRKMSRKPITSVPPK